LRQFRPDTATEFEERHKAEISAMWRPRGAGPRPGPVDRDHEDEQPEHILVAGADQCCEKPERAQVSLGHFLVAINLGLLDLQLSERLGFGGSLGNEVGPRLALLVGERHRGSGAAFAGGLLDRAVDLADPAMPSRSTVRLPISPARASPIRSPCWRRLPWRCAIRSQWAARPILSIRRSRPHWLRLRTADIKSEGMTVVGTAEMGTTVLRELDRLAARWSMFLSALSP
jgi:hypothetical protein